MISVIVPVYNVEKYLPKCIDSIINQTYTDLEILLIDDGSTDNSGKICDNYAKKDKRIKVIHKKNGGLSDARNTGLNICTGDYISFIDSDDYIEPDMYDKMINTAIANDIDIISCNYNHIYNEQNFSPFFKTNTDELITNKTKLLKLIFTYQNFDLVVFNKLYKANLFKNIRFPKGISPAEDLNILYPLISSSNKFYYINEALYNKTERINSLSHTIKIQDCLNNVQGYEKFLYDIQQDSSLDYNTIFNACLPTLFRHYKHLLDKIFLLDISNSYKTLEQNIINKLINLYDNNTLSNKDKAKIFLLKINPSLYKKYRILSYKWKSYKQNRGKNDR